ncbi:MAG: hypothetical protein ACK5KN_07540 [Dysgonomonas sp.]|uniref:hypothetical protein n=1 Tax=Dysgonomonas sp. TaxID=1891233 RepID=UPI003A8590CD
MSNKPNFAKMKRNPLKDKYDMMALRYSGEVENKCNVYTCRSCRHKVKTVDENTGVTPMFIRCDRCNDLMNSAMYNDTMPGERPTKGWYRPSYTEFHGLSASEQDHVLKGGLLLRDIKFV